MFLNGIPLATYVFTGRDILIWFKVGLFSWFEERQVSLKRKPCVLEAGGSSTLLPSENSLTFGKELVLQHRCFQVEVGSVCSK
jgi:hypothetical protein